MRLVRVGRGVPNQPMVEVGRGERPHSTEGAKDRADDMAHLSCRRSLFLWFSLTVHTTNAYAEAIEKAFTLARNSARRARPA
ncbi:hypothetical protein GCM10010302_24960 [Streptomyces polychromogenes]|uniref:Transposase n=1 Tax=Streptomyces polychromogenes TaxID=67342 RepID=A0ABN0VC83_9ACTN